jgi:hypothetical protein
VKYEPTALEIQLSDYATYQARGLSWCVCTLPRRGSTEFVPRTNWLILSVCLTQEGVAAKQVTGKVAILCGTKGPFCARPVFASLGVMFRTDSKL